MITGWPNTTNQYNSSSGNNRVQYPSQQPQSQTPQQQQQSQQQTPPVGPVSSTPAPGGIASSQQWVNQQPNRTTPQPTLNAIAHAPPPWDHRYTNQPSPLYPAPGNHQVLYLFNQCFYLESNLHCLYNIFIFHFERRIKTNLIYRISLG